MLNRFPFLRASLPGIALAVLVTASMFALCLTPSAYSAEPVGAAHAASTGTLTLRAACVEGDACWSWSTMGNRKRGVVTVNGTPIVVGPCRFARMYAHARALRMAWLFDAQRMRGDRFAIVMGCDM